MNQVRLGRPVDMGGVRREIIFQFGRHLRLDPRPWDIEGLHQALGMRRQEAALESPAG
jgi:hypothetical protein